MNPAVALPNGALLPRIGFGTYKIPPAETQAAVEAALEVGYRHVDTATMYGNEAEVGRALRAAGLGSSVFVTTKLDNIARTQASVRNACEASCAALGVDAVDLYLIHWPLNRTTDIVATWEFMLQVRELGLARAVGVSNFTADHLTRIIEATGEVPAVNQVEVNPYLAQNELRALHREWGIVTEAWSPLARGRIFDDPVVRELADRVGRTPSQVVLRWHLQRGNVVMPKSVHHERMAENLAVTDFALDAVVMRTIDRLNVGERSGSHPDRVELGEARPGAQTRV